MKLFSIILNYYFQNKLILLFEYLLMHINNIIINPNQMLIFLINKI